VGRPAIHALAFGPDETLAVATELGLAVRQAGAWRTLRGGPSRNRVTAVAVTGDGAAWFGFGDDQFSPAGGGLSRFDGSQWQYFLDNANVRVLSVAPDGALWAGAGCRVQRFQDDSWQLVAQCDDLGGGNVLDLAFGPEGEVWAATGMSLARYDGQTWQVFEGLVHSIAVAPDGTLWAAGWGGTQGAYYTAYLDPAALPGTGEPEWTKVRDEALASLVVSGDGTAWGISGDLGLVRFRDGAWAAVPGPDGETIHGSLAVGPEGALWVSGPEQLARFDGSAWAVYPGLEGAQALAVAPDGTLWFGTDNGAVHVDPGEVQP
jgi:ligand-binding sensor domain-containing protein